MSTIQFSETDIQKALDEMTIELDKQLILLGFRFTITRERILDELLKVKTTEREKIIADLIKEKDDDLIVPDACVEINMMQPCQILPKKRGRPKKLNLELAV